MLSEDIFKLYPPFPDTDSKLTIATEKPQRDSLTLSVESWRRILPNKSIALINNKQGISYQCSGLDANCIIEVKIAYKFQTQVISKVLYSQKIEISNPLKQQLLYEAQPIKTRVKIDKFQTYLFVAVKNKKLTFKKDANTFQLPLNESSIQTDFCLEIIKFLNFFLKIINVNSKIISNFCVVTFNSKQERDTFTAQITLSFQTIETHSQNEIKIINVGGPKTQKSIHHDNSASSFTSINKSQHKEKKKVKISEKINLKKSYSKVNSGNTKELNTRLLNNLEDEKYTDTNSIVKGQDSFFNDNSMDLRGSFQELEMMNEGNNQQEDDAKSNGSFQPQTKGNWLNPIDQQNKKLREENKKLKQQMQQYQMFLKQFQEMKKKYEVIMKENSRLESQRRAIITDKVRFQSNFYRQQQQKQALRRQLETLKSSPSYRKL